MQLFPTASTPLLRASDGLPDGQVGFGEERLLTEYEPTDGRQRRVEIVRTWWAGGHWAPEGAPEMEGKRESRGCDNAFQTDNTDHRGRCAAAAGPFSIAAAAPRACHGDLAAGSRLGRALDSPRPPHARSLWRSATARMDRDRVPDLENPARPTARTWRLEATACTGGGCGTSSNTQSRSRWCLPDAQHIPNLPGRKSDRKDAAWIAGPLAHGDSFFFRCAGSFNRRSQSSRSRSTYMLVGLRRSVATRLLDPPASLTNESSSGCDRFFFAFSNSQRAGAEWCRANSTYMLVGLRRSLASSGQPRLPGAGGTAQRGKRRTGGGECVPLS